MPFVTRASKGLSKTKFYPRLNNELACFSHLPL